MKKLFHFLIAAAVLIAPGCEESPKEPDPVKVASVSVAPTSLTLKAGTSEQLTATVLPEDAADKAVTWSSSVPGVATVSNGVVSAISAGTATITVKTSDGGKTATCTLTVTEDPVPVITITTQPTAPEVLIEGSIPENTGLTVEASVTEEATLSYQWYTYDPETDELFEAIEGATDASYTLPTDLAAGEHWFVCEISAEGAESKRTDPVTVTVTEKVVAVTGVSLEPTALELEIGSTKTLIAILAPENATNQNVTWSSSDETIATVDAATGEVTAIAPGETTIAVTTREGEFTAECAVTVKPEEDVLALIPDTAFRTWLREQGYIRIIDGQTGEIEVTAAGLEVREMYLQSIDAKTIRGIELFPDLQLLEVPDTVEELDLSAVPQLMYLSYNGDKLSTIDLSHTPELYQLAVGGNGLTSIDTGMLPKLSILDCRCPFVTSLDLTPLTNLSMLVLTGSGITSLDISENPALGYMDCRGTPLEEIYVWWEGGLNGVPTYITTFEVPSGVEFIYKGNERQIPLELLPDSVDPRSVLVDYTISPEQWERLASIYAFSELQAITREAYTKFNDDFDYIFYVMDVQGDEVVNRVGFVAANSPVSNSTQGLGIDVVSFARQWGSSGKLKSVMYFPMYDGISHGPVLHEIAHNWAAFIEPRRRNPDDTVENGGHWSVSNAGGQLGGFRYIRTVEENSGGVPGKTLYQASFYPDKNSDGSFRQGFGDVANGGNGPAYSDIELYLMGMKSAQELRDANFTLDIYSGNNFEFGDGSHGFDHGYFWSTTKTSYTIDDIIALNGPRVPDAASSQKEFKILTVVLTREGQTTHHYADIIKGLRWLAGPEGDSTYPGWVIKNFKEATYGRGTLVVDGVKNSLKSQPGSNTFKAIPPAPAPNNYRGRMYIDRVDKDLIAAPHRR